MNCLPHSELESFAEFLIDGLKAELYLTPKPGLVDLYDNGSHKDLSPAIMLQSIRFLRDYLSELCIVLQRNHEIEELIAVGKRAEERMLKQLGTNCHRGGIFLCGLLLTARSHCTSNNPRQLQKTVAKSAKEFFLAGAPLKSKGQQTRERFQIGGIIEEATLGLPTLFDIALPTLSDCSAAEEHRIFLTMARVMQCLEDTTTMHRCGQTGLARLKKAGKQLEMLILSGDEPTPFLFQLNRDFKTMNLTMGGVADLLGISFGYYSYLQQTFSKKSLPSLGATNSGL